MNRFFIADLHLSENEPIITMGFFRFLSLLPNDCELYILGDFFDYWIGDDLITPWHNTIIKALSDLSSRNIKKFIIHGNRDFLLGKKFAKLSDVQLLPEFKLLDNQNCLKLAILHGDILCTDDHSYQKFRKKMHNKWLQFCFLLLPRFLRKKIANKLRNTSQQHNQKKDYYVMDVNQQTVLDKMMQYNIDILIHGHTHKPAIHNLIVKDKEVKRMVLGAWHDGFNYIHQQQDGSIEYVKFK